jgi:hypothetical protein
MPSRGLILVLILVLRAIDFLDNSRTLRNDESQDLR